MKSDELAIGAAFAATLATARFGVAALVFLMLTLPLFFALTLVLFFAFAVALFLALAFVLFFALTLVLFFTLFSVLIVRTPLPGRLDVSCLCRSAGDRACAGVCTAPRCRGLARS